MLAETSPQISFSREAFYERGHFFVPGNNVIVRFRIQGKITEKQVQDAIIELRKVHPMIGVHIEFDATRTGWFIGKNTPPCPIKIYPRSDENSWIQAIFKEYWIPFKITEGPLIRFLLIEGEAMSDLVAFAHHAICDGLSLVYLLRDLMLLIGDPRIKLPNRHYVPTFKEIYDLNSIKLNPFIQKFVDKINKVWQQNATTFSESDFAPLHTAFSSQKLHALTWEINSELIQKVIDRCHQEKISVNDVLYCAILNVQHRLQGDREHFRNLIMMPVNIRNMVQPPIGEAVGLFAGGETFKIKLNWKQTFWQQARRIHKILQKQITPNTVFGNAKRAMLFDPNLMDGRALLLLGGLFPNPPPKYYDFARIIEKDRFLAKLKSQRTQTQVQLGTVLTNLGAVDIPETYGSYQLDRVVFFPPTSPFAEKLIGTVTFKNQLQGTLTFVEKTLNPQIAEQFIQLLKEFIKQVVQ